MYLAFNPEAGGPYVCSSFKPWVVYEVGKSNPKAKVLLPSPQRRFTAPSLEWFASILAILAVGASRNASSWHLGAIDSEMAVMQAALGFR